MTLKYAIIEYVHIALQSPKVAANVGIGTIFAATFREWIDGILLYLGTGAASIGAILSIVLIYNNIRGGIIKRRLDMEEYQVAKLQKEQLTRELDEIRKKNG